MPSRSSRPAGGARPARGWRCHRSRTGEHRARSGSTRELTLEGEPGAVLDGGGTGSVVTVTAPEVIVRGADHPRLGPRSARRWIPAFSSRRRRHGRWSRTTGSRAICYGVYVHGATGSRVRATTSIGIATGRMNEAGNGVSVWNAPGATSRSTTRSASAATASSRSPAARNVFSGNRFRDVRFAVHYMYTNDSEVSGNVSVGNTSATPSCIRTG